MPFTPAFYETRESMKSKFRLNKCVSGVPTYSMQGFDVSLLSFVPIEQLIEAARLTQHKAVAPTS